MSESLRRGAQVLDALARSPAPLSARELAGRVGLAKSTVQRLLVTLEECELAAKDVRSRKYHLGPRTLTLGMAYRSRLDLRSVALPHMTRLRDTTGETVGLTVRVGGARMYLEQVQSRSELYTGAEVGRPYPLWSGAPGRVLLAGMPDEEVGTVLDEAGPAALRVVDPPTREAFREVIAQVRLQGYEEAFGETIPGINTVAAPVRDGSGATTAALSLTGPASRFLEDEMRVVLGELTAAADAVTVALGGSQLRTPAGAPEG